eukprot:SAG11_NODE_2151_length_3742_cov_1.578644_7_plen_81_part_00
MAAGGGIGDLLNIGPHQPRIDEIDASFALERLLAHVNEVFRHERWGARRQCRFVKSSEHATPPVPSLYFYIGVVTMIRIL